MRKSHRVLGADKASWEDNPMLGILLFNQGQDVANEVKHRLPVRTGLSFAYRINDRLSIESGLLYTLLTSDLKYGSESHYIAGQQKLHYIGVPVNARYRCCPGVHLTSMPRPECLLKSVFREK